MSKGNKGTPAWFTPQQKIDSRQYYWQKLEVDRYLLLKLKVWKIGNSIKLSQESACILQNSDMYSFSFYWVESKKGPPDTNFTHDIADDERINYYNNVKKDIKTCQYDILFHFQPGWDQYIWRCDMENPKIIQQAIHQEEKDRIVPCLTSSNYGHRKTQLEGRAMFVHKKTQTMKEMYRTNGVNMKPNIGLPMNPNVSLC